MALTLTSASNKTVSPKTYSIVYIRSIEVKFWDERNKYPVSIKTTLGEGETDKSKQYDKDDYIHWGWEKRLPSDSKLTLTIREHHKFNRIKDVAYVAIPVSDLVMKPFFETVAPNWPSTSFIVHCGEVGPFIDVIHHLVEQSQNRLDEVRVFLDKFGRACEILGYIVTFIEAASSVHSAAKVAANAAKVLLETCQKLTKYHGAASELMEDVATFLPFANLPKMGLKSIHTVKTTEEILILFEKMCRTITACFNGFVVGGSSDVRIEEISAFKEKFKRLKEAFGWCLMTEIWQTTMKIEANTDDLLVRKLKPVMEASYREDQLCFEGSRMDTLRAIETWSESDSSPPVFWLSGSSGLGKSRVAHTVAGLFNEQNRLAAYFFAEKGHTSERVMPTIAYQLAKWHAVYRSKLLNVLRGREELQLYSGPNNQFELLMKQRVAEISMHPAAGQKPLIIILDALENCRDPPSCIRPFVDYVVKIATLVPWLKVFVTSGASKTIENRFGKSGPVVQHLAIDDPMLDFYHDVVAYARLREGHRSTCEEWAPGVMNGVRGLLTRITKSLDIPNGIQAAEISRQMTGTWEREKVSLIISRVVLERMHGGDVSVSRCILAVMTCLISVKAPTEDVLFHFLRSSHPDITQDFVHNIISHLSPIIYSTGENMLHLLPPPDILSDYLSNLQESGHFYIDMESLKYEVAQCCLSSMNTELDFSTCGLGDPQLSSEDAPDVKESSAHISGVLRYCALYWIDLVTQSGDKKLHHEVANFLCTNKIFAWIKVLSLLGELDAGREILLKCVDQYKAGSKVLLAARDISQFEPAIKQGVPHFCISMLTWSSLGSPVTSGVAHGSSLGLAIAFERIAMRTENAKCIYSRNDIVCVSRSPDGSRIVSGSRKGTLDIWDGWTGERISGPIEGHTGSVNDVKYSPDGTKFVSGSLDRTVKIWDALTGRLVWQLMSDSHVFAVAYSPDGGRVASGHWDGVRIWDSQKGNLVVESRYRQFVVCSMSYSPDGTRIVSGSRDGTLMIWNAESGAAVSQPLRGHESCVDAVTYSHDGSRIVSGSWGTVRIWDAHSGAPIGEPLKGHENWVIDVGFSQDGCTIISVSMDKTIRFWNASDGASVGVLSRGESRWDTERQHFVSIPHWWPKSWWKPFTTQALVYSANPIYIPDDGWIRTSDGGLFLWVPPGHRDCPCHAAPESTMTTNPLDERLKNSAWKHIPQWADIKRMMTEEEPNQD